MPLVVKDKGQNEGSRFENLQDYCLDKQTLDFLEEHHAEWLLAPWEFDGMLNSSQKTFLRPETRAISQYLLTEQDQI